jgi:ABC-type branched-subunit amino acid transport system substrate-binding protein
MSELAGEGAALIIAGVDPAQSEAAAKYAADNMLPVILLTPDPSDLKGLSSFIFLLGASPEETTKALSDALRADGAKVVAGFGEPNSAAGAAPGVGLVRPCDGTANVGDLKAERADAIVTFDGAYCTADLFTLGDALKGRVGVGLGVNGLYPPANNALVLSAGVFPISRQAVDPRLAQWLGQGRLPPSWWSALAHDAALLAYEAVKDLEDTGAEDASGVRARRQEAAVALAQARATLWTTDTRGFIKSQRIQRKLNVAEGASVAR